jgi:Peptidase of plants and bacteria
MASVLSLHAEPRTVVKIATKEAAALVDTNDAPDLKDWGKKAGSLCVEWFPRITELLPSDGFKAPKEVTLYFDPKMKGVAHALGGRITISAAFVREHLDDWGMVVHELTHVVQAYPPGGPGWLVEGIADYVRIVHFEPQAPRPKIDPERASYKDAYKTAAMFLEWIELNHCRGLVVQMNAVLRRGDYRDELWARLTGKTVDELWVLFMASLKSKS